MSIGWTMGKSTYADAMIRLGDGMDGYAQGNGVMVRFFLILPVMR